MESHAKSLITKGLIDPTYRRGYGHSMQMRPQYSPINTKPGVHRCLPSRVKCAGSWRLEQNSPQMAWYRIRKWFWEKALYLWHFERMMDDTGYVWLNILLSVFMQLWRESWDMCWQFWHIEGRDPQNLRMWMWNVTHWSRSLFVVTF